MTFPLKALSALLNPAKSVLGVVVSVTGTQVRVATAQGVRVAQVAGNVTVGSRVTVVDGVAIPAPVPRVVISV